MKQLELPDAMEEEDFRDLLSHYFRLDVMERTVGTPKYCVDTYNEVLAGYGSTYCYLISAEQYEYFKGAPSLQKKVYQICTKFILQLLPTGYLT